MKRLLILGLTFSQFALAHDWVRCLSPDQQAYSFLNFDGNGNPLVTASLRIGATSFAAKISPGHFPLRRQAIPMQADFGDYVLTLGLSDKTAMVSKVGVKNEFGTYVSDGTPELILQCCTKEDLGCDYRDPKAPPEN